MRRTLLFSAALLAAASAMNAQETTDNGYTAIPTPENDNAIMFSISPNGRYVGGYTYVDNKFYMYDTKEKTTKSFGEASEDNSADIRSISNEGKAVGLFGSGSDTYGYVCNFADGTSKTIEAGMTKGITSDGTFMTGAKMDESGAYWNAVYFDGENTVALPEPSTKWAGWKSTDPDDPEVVFGSSADFVSADKSVIAGSIIDPMSTYPVVVWRQNRDGKTYSVDFISRNYFCCNPDYMGTDANNYALFEPMGLSENGKWLSLTVAIYTPDGWGATYGVGRYDLENDKLEQYLYDDGSDTECYASGIANDGTLIGWKGGFNEEQGIIWKTGTEAPQLLSEAYPGVPEFTEFDTILGHKPCAISSDGRYIVGYGYYDRTEGETEAAGYESYVFDTTAPGATTAIEAAPAISKETISKAAAARYDISGKRVGKNFKGLSIQRVQNGKAVKTLNK